MKKYLLILTGVLLFFSLKANHLRIENTLTVGSSASTAYIQCQVSWENSWRDTSNYDGVWLFAFFRKNGVGLWQPLSFHSHGHTVPLQTTIKARNDGRGCLVFRSQNGTGTFSSSLSLAWNLIADSVSPQDKIDVRLFGIEMVHVPSGSFYLGDGNNQTSQVYGNFEEGNTGQPYLISSENAINLGGGSSGSLNNHNRHLQMVRGGGGTSVDCSNDGCLGGSGDDFHYTTTQTLPAAFPKGFNGFWCMKYELTQQQFVDMLNTLETSQQNGHLTSTTPFYHTVPLQQLRYGIQKNGNLWESTNPHIPMVFLDWMKAAAFADWAGLRPMTELEFEKACRGRGFPTKGEYAWGNALINLTGAFTLSDTNQTQERILNHYDSSGQAGNAWINSPGVTMNVLARVGIFAAHPSNRGRISSGSTYWGIMEMSGMAWERAVSVGHPEGRRFTGTHGDGRLASNGLANVDNWPGSNAGIVNSNLGMGYRGGGLAYPAPNIYHNAQISNRRLASGYWDIVIHDDGARLVLTDF